ncbi:MAG: 2-succinyl-5-enolpyruvyl-6-hydroxy-3-cyclohexene-1-carboxylic-acid synthase [Actinobacteria bacterium]|nr:2-succinyl-5-enolpyruvyl-6-hydroxy-3-cyclohexene-1-carboxylic-acid synthase [Actinomycetota bacterium]
MRADLNTALAATLVDEWGRAGVTEACVAPGSRSTPLALALAADARFRVHVFLDERSAAFFALGTARASGRPAVVLCTSGTAAAEFHPAVLEASHGRVPLIACTADRPPELRDTGAGQTIDQVKLFGEAVRWFAEVGPADTRPPAMAAWRPVAARAVAEAVGVPPGPVHLNLVFPEPLVPTGDAVPVVAGRADGRPWVETREASATPRQEDVAALAEAVERSERGVVVAGWGADAHPDAVEAFARVAGWPVLADPLSGLRRSRSVVSTYDALLRVPSFAADHRPDLVVRVGAPLTSRVATEWLDSGTRQVIIDHHGAWLDPQRAAAERFCCDPTLLLAALTRRLPAERRTPSLASWLEADRIARSALDRLLDSWTEPFEGRVARDLVVGLPDGATLVVASSMPVRDLEWFAPARAGLRFLANRGVNGIDGFVSTVLGVASVAEGPVVSLGGDLSFLHDSNGLLGASGRGLDVVFVVLDNDGGGIFSFLPQAELPDHFERLFGTPHGVDLVALAGVHGVPASRVETATDVIPAVEKALADGGPHVVVVPTDRDENVARHREAWAAVAHALTLAMGG